VRHSNLLSENISISHCIIAGKNLGSYVDIDTVSTLELAVISVGYNIIGVGDGWDLKTGQEKGKLTGHTAHVHSVSYSSDGTSLASGSADNTIRLWDLEFYSRLLEKPDFNLEIKDAERRFNLHLVNIEAWPNEPTQNPAIVNPLQLYRLP